MENSKIDRVIEAFRNYIRLREEMMTANPVGKGGGLGSQVDPTGKNGTPGFDPVMGAPLRRDNRTRKRIKITPGQRVRWRNP